MENENLRSDWLELIHGGIAENKKFFGTVQYFKKQIGFILPDNGMSDVFFRWNEIEPQKKEKWKSVRGVDSHNYGDRVMFEISLFNDRPVGVNIQVFRDKSAERLAKEDIVNFNIEYNNNQGNIQ